MSVQHVASTSVNTFPSSMREVADPYSRFTTEKNLVDIITRLSDGGNFVTSFDNTDNTIDFTLGGYHFVVTFGGNSSILNLIADGGSLWAFIILRQNVENVNASITLKGFDGTTIQNNVDSNSEFIGVSFTTSETDIPTDISGVIKLKILQKNNNSFIIPEESASPNKFEIIENTDIDNMFNGTYGS